MDPTDPSRPSESESIVPGPPIVPPNTASSTESELSEVLVSTIGDEPADIVVIENTEPDSMFLAPVLIAALASALLASAITVGVLYAFGAFDRQPDRIETIIREPVVASGGDLVASDGDVVARVASQAIPSIVTVQRFDSSLDLGPLGSGSGVVYRSDGFILTNHHVVAGADLLKVVFADGLTYTAELVGTDPLMDIAVLKIGIDRLPAIPIGNLDDAAIGNLAIAVGNPLGLDGGPSVTSGVISAFDRTLAANGLSNVNDLYGLLQTDAPITRGSSGGALLDRDGRLIGITTAIGVSDVGAEGLGFAVPVSLVVPIANELISEGAVQHAFLGIEGEAAFVRRSDGSEVPLGAEIRQLLEDSAIGDAGAKQGDVIVALDGQSVNSMILLVARLRSYRAGDEITVTVDRNGENVDVTLVLDQHPLG